MARNTPKQKIAIELELEPSDLAVLSEASEGQNVTTFVKKYAEQLINGVANGGLMLSGDEISQITRSTNTPVTSSSDVVDLAEKGQKRSRGNFTFEVTLDPSIVASFEQSAQFLGLTPEEFCQSCWSYIHANGWLTQMQPDVYWVPLSMNDLKKVKDATGVHLVTSSDVVAALRSELAKAAEDSKA